MKTMTRMNAFTLFALAAVTLGVATWEPENGSTHAANPALLAPSFTATADTGWLPAAQARQEIEELGAALDRLALERGFGLRVLDSNAQLRTRTADGARLDAPVARFERSFEFRVRHAGELESLRSTLTTLDVRFGSPTPRDEHYASRGRPIGF